MHRSIRLGLHVQKLRTLVTGTTTRSNAFGDWDPLVCRPIAPPLLLVYAVRYTCSSSLRQNLQYHIILLLLLLLYMHTRYHTHLSRGYILEHPTSECTPSATSPMLTMQSSPTHHVVSQVLVKLQPFILRQELQHARGRDISHAD